MKLGWITWFAFFAVGWTAMARADLLVSDNFGSQVLRYDQNTGAYLGTAVPYNSGGLDGAIGLRLDANGDLLVTSQNTQAILRYDLYSGAFLGTFASNATTPGAQLSQPADLVWGPDGNLYVANFAGNSVDRFTPGGAALGKFATSGSTTPTLILGTASGIFGPDGNLYVTTYSGNINVGDRIFVFQGPAAAQPGALISIFATATTQNGMSGPADMLFDSSGNLYVASLLSHAVLEFSVTSTKNPAGVVTSVTGTYLRQFATGNGSFPASMLFAADGTMLVAETGATGVYRYDVSDANFGAPLGEFTSGGNPTSPLQVPGEMLYVPNANQWVGPAGGTWATMANWTTGAIPTTNADVALMWDNLTASSTIDLGGATQTVQRIDFDTHSNSVSYDVHNGTLVLDGGTTGNARISAQGTNNNDQFISANIKYNTATVITNASQNGHLLILAGKQDWNGQSVSVLSGGLKFNTSASAINTAGASLSISSGASVELAGTASSTSDGTNGVTVNNGGILKVSGTNQMTGTISGTGTTNVGTDTGNGILIVTADHSIHQGALNIGNSFTPGTAKVTITASTPSSYVSQNTTVPTGNSAGTSILTSLSIANDGAGTYYGTLDLQNNNLVINYTGPTSPVDDVRKAIQSAYVNGVGDWSGEGLTSSLMNLDPNQIKFALVYDENSNRPVPFDSGINLFEGVPVAAQAVLVKYSWIDDVNMDGIVNFDDLQQFKNNYLVGAVGHTYSQGDLNYDGVITFDDNQIFKNNYQNGGFAELPEPGSIVLAGLGLLGLLLVRRKRARN